MIKISKRLETISSLIPLNSKIIDIGCDHALLDIYAYQNNITKDILVADINKNALTSGINNLKINNLENKIKAQISDGLKDIDTNNKDTIIISGMGTNTIIKILEDSKEKLSNINCMILQSNTKLYELRKYVTTKGYLIQDEEIVKEDNKYYEIIRFEKGNKKYQKKELSYGPLLLEKKSKVLEEKINKEIKKNIEIYKKLPYYKLIKRMEVYLKIKELQKIKNQLNK